MTFDMFNCRSNKNGGFELKDGRLPVIARRPQADVAIPLGAGTLRLLRFVRNDMLGYFLRLYQALQSFLSGIKLEAILFESCKKRVRNIDIKHKKI